MQKRIGWLTLLMLIGLLAACGDAVNEVEQQGPGSTTCIWDNPGSTWDNCTWGP